MKNETMENATLSYEYDSGNTAFMLASTALVFLMIPGVGYFYSGMARRKTALSLIMLCCWSMAVVSVQVSKIIVFVFVTL